MPIRIEEGGFPYTTIKGKLLSSMKLLTSVDHALLSGQGQVSLHVSMDHFSDDYKVSARAVGFGSQGAACLGWSCVALAPPPPSQTPPRPLRHGCAPQLCLALTPPADPRLASL
jgi:hypothetical protein